MLLYLKTVAKTGSETLRFLKNYKIDEVQKGDYFVGLFSFTVCYKDFSQIPAAV
jgi:hypothetical protein